MTNKLEEKRVQWRQHVENWKSSSLSQKSNCATHNLKPNQFWYWHRQYNEVKNSASSPNTRGERAAAGFIAVQIDSPRHNNYLWLEFLNGIRLHGDIRNCLKYHIWLSFYTC